MSLHGEKTTCQRFNLFNYNSLILIVFFPWHIITNPFCSYFNLSVMFTNNKNVFFALYNLTGFRFRGYLSFPSSVGSWLINTIVVALPQRSTWLCNRKVMSMIFFYCSSALTSKTFLKEVGLATTLGCNYWALAYIFLFNLVFSF